MVLHSVKRASSRYRFTLPADDAEGLRDASIVNNNNEKVLSKQLIKLIQHKNKSENIDKPIRTHCLLAKNKDAYAKKQKRSDHTIREAS